MARRLKPLIEACAASDRLGRLQPHPELDAFRKPELQHAALLGLAADRRCCVSIAGSDGLLVGYAAFHPPSGIETWGEDQSGALIELGAIEVAPRWRAHRLAERILAASFATGRFESTVVFATMYAWHYDLRRTGLSEFGYRGLLERLYRRVGMERLPTSDPEIRSSAANALVARVGTRAPTAVVEEFDRLRLRPMPPA